jgi:hypothetical protein
MILIATPCSKGSSNKKSRTFLPSCDALCHESSLTLDLAGAGSRWRGFKWFKASKRFIIKIVQ